MKHVLITGMTPNHGGVESFIYNYVSKLQGPIKFDFYCSNTGCAYQKELEALGCHVYFGARYGKSPRKARSDIQDFFSKNAWKYDVLWHNTSMLLHIDELRYAEKYGIKKRILHSHNSANMYPGITGLVKGVFHQSLKKEASRLATDYWACSREAGLYFYNNKILDSEKYLFVPNAIDAKSFRYNEAKRREIRNRYDIDENALVIGFVGRLQFQKNPELVIRAFSEVHRVKPNSYLLLVGNGVMKERCEQLIHELDIDDSVILTGAVDDAAPFYQAMDVFCLPSRFEGLPVVLLEAQAAGLPCLISDSITEEATVVGSLIHPVDIHCSYQYWGDVISNLSINKDRIADNNIFLGSIFEIGLSVHTISDALQS